MRAAGTTEAYLSWAVFTAVAVGGAATILQAVRIGRIGMGYILAMGPSAAFIAVCITAVAEGGPAMLATLVVITSLVPLVLSYRLSLFQRLLTPTVAGTVIMLIPITVMPAILNLLSATPPGTPGPICPAECARNNHHHQRHRAEGDRRVAPVGTCHRRCRWLDNWRLLRSIRHRPRRLGFVDRHTDERMAGLRSQF